MKTKIPIKKYVVDLSQTAEERFNQLLAHHEEETAFLIKKIEELEDAEDYAAENVDSIIRSVAEHEFNKGYDKGYEEGRRDAE